MTTDCPCQCCVVYGPIPTKLEEVHTQELLLEMMKALHAEETKLREELASAERDVARADVVGMQLIDERDAFKVDFVAAMSELRHIAAHGCLTKRVATMAGKRAHCGDEELCVVCSARRAVRLLRPPPGVIAKALHKGTKEVDAAMGRHHYCGECREEKSMRINIIFDGPPGPEAGRFVEVEDDNGKSISVGEWKERDDGLWALALELAEPKEGK